uniref:RNA methyltransferase n=1 Tax=Timema bartmani TaxID=61472 RepID=A0A7R9ENV8_9NEOP|nr:unnamed protein product [Timema bartmani]
MDNNLNFKGGDPGAVKFGNFINYYSFNLPENRLKLLPDHLWRKSPKTTSHLVALDVGCNSGVNILRLITAQYLSSDFNSRKQKHVDLTQCLYEFLIDRCCGGTCHILGVDIDPVLVERARRSNIHRDNVLYDCVDVTRDQDREELFSQYLWKHGRAKFDIVFCFSVTMWIHLNSGDEGLTKFLTDICRQTDWLVVEPQPWKCYKEAERRLRRSGGGSFPLFPSLTMRGRVESDIESILQQQCQFTKVLETSKTRWNRKLSFYRTNSLS